MASNMRSMSWPLTPTNGLPRRSSSAPGASPTIMTGEPTTPSANTVFFAVRLSAQPSKARTAASSSSTLLQRCARARASSTSWGDSMGTGPRTAAGAAGAGRSGVGAAGACRWTGGGAACGADAAKRSMASSPMASSIPWSTYQRSSDSRSSRAIVWFMSGVSGRRRGWAPTGPHRRGLPCGPCWLAVQHR
jgi:hypothetical protein